VFVGIAPPQEQFYNDRYHREEEEEDLFIFNHTMRDPEREKKE
jgi:hypothetical protein